ncbi:MAG: sulfite exporter TauE/SafE family protein [Propioniciclava sp.]
MFSDVLAFGWPALAALAAAAVVVGFAKTSFGGMGAVAVAIFALVMPAKESTATVLLLLIVGDLVAVIRYRQVNWKLLWQLVPAVVPGLLLGALFMSYVDDLTMRRTIGALLLSMVLLQLWLRRSGAVGSAPTGGKHLGATAGAGIAAGFTTMTANAAGPVMALYFLAQRIDKLKFIGTNAWFFALINLSKVPLAASLGLFTPEALLLDALLIPAVLLGAAIGAWVIGRVSQRQFETVTLVASLVASLALLLR